MDRKIEEAFQKIRSITIKPNTARFTDAPITLFYKDELNTIESELKRLEEDVETWKEVAKHKENEFNIIHEECERLTYIKNKQDEILRIIKEKGVDVRYLQECENLKQYNGTVVLNWNDEKEAEYHNELLTQEEFDLLKKQFSEN